MRAEAAVRTGAALLRAYEHASWLEGMAIRAQWWRWRFFIASRSTPQMHLWSICSAWGMQPKASLAHR